MTGDDTRKRALRAVEKVRGYRDRMLTRDDIRAALTAALAAQHGDKK